MAKANNLGIPGWFYAGRYGPQRYAYTLQRLTGVGIILYLIAHIYVTGFKIQGPEAWGSVMNTVRYPLLHVGEFLVFMAIIIHAVNGIRLMWVELGFFLGRPTKNIYPYQTCLDRNRTFFYATFGVILVLAAIGIADFFNFL